MAVRFIPRKEVIENLVSKFFGESVTIEQVMDAYSEICSCVDADLVSIYHEMRCFNGNSSEWAELVYAKEFKEELRHNLFLLGGC